MKRSSENTKWVFLEILVLGTEFLMLPKINAIARTLLLTPKFCKIIFASLLNPDRTLYFRYSFTKGTLKKHAKVRF